MSEAAATHDAALAGPALAGWAPRVLSLVRIVAGLLFLEHGLSKFFGWPNAAQHLSDFFSLGGASGALELVLGALLALGLFTRTAAFLASGEMAFAYFLVHAPKSFFPIMNMGDAAILYCFLFLYIAVAGGGPFGIDALKKR